MHRDKYSEGEARESKAREGRMEEQNFFHPLACEGTTKSKRETCEDILCKKIRFGRAREGGERNFVHDGREIDRV